MLGTGTRRGIPSAHSAFTSGLVGVTSCHRTRGSLTDWSRPANFADPNGTGSPVDLEAQQMFATVVQRELYDRAR